VLAGFALVTFLLASAVTIHDFWAVPEDQAEDELTGFLKNVALAVAAVGTSTWAYSVGLSVF